MKPKSSTKKIEFGDFQTPPDLATRCCRRIRMLLGDFDSIIEPTCGEGNFLVAAALQWPEAKLFGNDINRFYVKLARQAISDVGAADRAILQQADFFQTAASELRPSGQRALFLGNPPWVTNSQLGSMASVNLPVKRNLGSTRGVDAITGQSNFDISESILRSVLDEMQPGDGIGFLIKSSVARKFATYSWRKNCHWKGLTFLEIDAKKDFDVSVSAGLLVGELLPTAGLGGRRPVTQQCLGGNVSSIEPSGSVFGMFKGEVVADPVLAKRTAFAQQPVSKSWRSGIKHDVASVLVCKVINGVLTNGRNETVDIESDRLFPLAKGSDVAKNNHCDLKSFLILPQLHLSERTERFRKTQPKLYQYLQNHAEQFGKRRSVIYKGKDPFSIFGLGPYSFAKWKVAICSLYKEPKFTKFGPIGGKPVMFDDTVYQYACDSEQHADDVLAVLNSDPAQEFIAARTFGCDKRLVTAKLLGRLDLKAIAERLALPWPYCDQKPLGENTLFDM